MFLTIPKEKGRIIENNFKTTKSCRHSALLPTYCRCLKMLASIIKFHAPGHILSPQSFQRDVLKALACFDRVVLHSVGENGMQSPNC